MEHLRRYHAAFPREQVQVLIYDDFRADNEPTARSVLRFLDVDDAVADSGERGQSDGTPALAATARLVPRCPSAAAPRARAEGGSSRSPRAAARALRAVRRRVVFGEPQPPDERLMLELRRRFKPEVVALSEHLDRDLVTSGAMTRSTDL